MAKLGNRAIHNGRNGVCPPRLTVMWKYFEGPLWSVRLEYQIPSDANKSCVSIARNTKSWHTIVSMYECLGDRFISGRHCRSNKSVLSNRIMAHWYCCFHTRKRSPNSVDYQLFTCINLGSAPVAFHLAGQQQCPVPWHCGQQRRNQVEPNKVLLKWRDLLWQNRKYNAIGSSQNKD